MLITKTGPDSIFFDELVIADKHSQSAEQCWITVVVGENGAKKSLLLRNISEEILRSEERRKNIKIEGEVSKLICLSGTPLDRFPRVSNRVISRLSYFGLRASNNVAGTGQSEKSLVAALILNRNRLKNRALQIKSVFGQLGLKAIVKADLQISKRFLMYYFPSEPEGRFIDKILDAFFKHCQRYLSGGPVSVIAKKDYETAKRFIASDEGRNNLTRVILELTRKTYHITISTSGNYVSKNTFSIAIWRVLLEAGIVDLKKTWFQPNEDSSEIWGSDSIPGNHLSSGQWSWLCTLGGLAAEVDDESVILIDEPENSLHPAWQRDYIPAILNILQGMSGCHVILATHSPLVASGLPPSSGNVRRLLRQYKDGASTVASIEAPNTFGWSASDAYEALFGLETTRAKVFNAEATKALEMIRDRSGTASERAEVALALRSHCESLPALDSMRHAMERVAASLERS